MLRMAAIAEAEMLEASSWYSNQKSGLGSQFLDACHHAMDEIEAGPDSFARMETVKSRRDIRRSLLDRFPYAIVFEILRDEIVVLAIAHVNRRPNYWIRRKPLENRPD